MIISLIVAMDETRGIGKGNLLLWRQSTDMQRFKNLTMGHHVIMGRKTYESIGRPLPGRTMIVLTHNPAYQPPGQAISAQPIQFAGSLQQALALAQAAGEGEAFVVGGGEIFALALPLAGRIYLTTVLTHLECDTFFPQFEPSEWRVIAETTLPADEKNQYPTRFQIYERKPSAA